MKKIILALCALSTTQVFAEKQDGTLKFTGSIYNATCAIEINNNGGGTTGSVGMGRHPTSAFPTRGSEAGGEGGEGEINIELSDCPNEGTLTVSFTGELMDGFDEILKLDNYGDDSVAGGIGITMYDQEGNDISFDGSTAISKKFTDKDSYTYSMTAKYYRFAENDSDVKAGRADGTLNFSIEYK